MSFILDALKKSEHERQRQTNPGLVESGVARPRPRLPMWALALCILLGVNLLVLLFVLLRGWITATQNPAPAPPASEHPARPSDVAAAGAADTHFSPLDATPVYAPEIPVTAPDNHAANPAPAPAARPQTHPAHRKDPQLVADDYKADDEEVLPTINELNLTGAQALPELHLDVHVFATQSNERFVYVNMRKYHEGATLQEGPTLERIRRDGVILDYQGLRFLLPRQ